MNNYFPKNITVLEQRAPTDESVRLLHEMEAQALTAIHEKIIFGNNEFQGTAYLYRDAARQEDVAYISFKLNSKLYIANIPTDAFLIPQRRLEIMVQHLATAIAEMLLPDIVKSYAKSQLTVWRLKLDAFNIPKLPSI